MAVRVALAGDAEPVGLALAVAGEATADGGVGGVRCGIFAVAGRNGFVVAAEGAEALPSNLAIRLERADRYWKPKKIGKSATTTQAQTA